MTTEHPTPETLERFFLGTLDGEATERVDGHLAEGCVPCALVSRELMIRTEPERAETFGRYGRRDLHGEAERHRALETGLGQAFARRTAIRGERALAPALLAELERRPPEDRREAVRTIERYQLFGLAEHLADTSLGAVFQDVARALELAGLAVEASEALDPLIYDAAFIAERRAYARACLGNARRVASDLVGSEQCFRDALLLLDRGTDLSLVPADVGSLLGSLRIDQGRYPEARAVLEEALEAYRRHELRTDECKVLLLLANAEAYAGNPERAVEILEEAVPLSDGLGNSQLRYQIHHNLTLWMVDAGRSFEAMARYKKARQLYDEQCAEPSLVLRRRWLEGRIYSGLGDAGLARTRLEEVRRAAAERGLLYELALVSLDLALVHLDRGDTARVKELAEGLAPVFRSYELHRHALAAVYLFRHVARQETATAELVREIIRYLERSRNNPYARFEAGAAG